MAKKKKQTKTVVKCDRGTAETRRYLSPDPLLTSNMLPHRLRAALEIRAALEDGLSAPSLDMVRIGMGGGATGDRDFIPTTPRNIELRSCLSLWRKGCKNIGIESHVVELFALGNSLRQIATQVHLRRTRCADIVDEGLDVFASLRGYRRYEPQPRESARIAVWEAPAADAPIPDPETPTFEMPKRAALRNRAIRKDSKTGEQHES